MTVPTTAWSETSPAGSDNINQGDNKIREMKTQIREVLDIDHQFNSSGSDADNGKHTQVSLLEQADIGSGAAGKPILGAQTVSGKAELMFTDEDDNDIQLTSGGTIPATSISGVYPAADLASIANIIAFIYPVGSVVTLGVSTNPATLFGVGTWTAIAGKVIVGLDSGQTEFDALNETGGSKTHTLTTDEIPAHTHTYLHNGSTVGSSAGGDGTQTLDSTATGSAGGGSAHNNLQPYIVKYVWERTA